MSFCNSSLRLSPSQVLSLLFLGLLIIFIGLESEHRSRTVFFVLVIVFACCLAVAVVYPVIVKGAEQHHERRPQLGDSVNGWSGVLPEQDAEFLQLVSDLPTTCKYRDLEIATDGFSVELGRGGFGTVYKGTLQTGTKVAVKKLVQRASEEGKREFYAEVATIARIHHVNLVQLLGFCAEAGRRALVYELMENGSLDKWIFGKKEKQFLNWKMRLNVCLDTARGLAYLHDDCREKILHLDVKPQNILLDKDFTAKVADFGLARAIGKSESRIWTEGIRGTPGYIAPEWLTAEGVTSKADVYSYGVVLLEVVSGRRCVDRRVEVGSDWFLPATAMRRAKEGRIADLIETAALEAGKDGESDRERAERALKVGCWCVQGNPAARPSMAAVVRMLEGVLQVAEPPTPGGNASFIDILYGGPPPPSFADSSVVVPPLIRLPPPHLVEEIPELAWSCNSCHHPNGVYIAVCRHCGHPNSLPPLSAESHGDQSDSRPLWTPTF